MPATPNNFVSWQRLRPAFVQLCKQRIVLLSLVLLIALLEPLTCVLHCTLWQPMLHPSGGVAHTHEAHAISLNSVFAHTFNEQVAAFHNRTISQVTTLAKLVQACVEPHGHFPSLAQPFHEFAVIPLLLGSILLMLCHFLVLHAPMLIPRSPENLLRPPIA